jgi:hypothetical protein
MAKQAEWRKRVAEWRASGLTAQDFAADRDFAPSTLTWWARRLSKELGATSLRVARVVRGRASSAVEAGGQTPRGKMVVELGVSRVHVPDGVDATTLETVLALLGAPGRSA